MVLQEVHALPNGQLQIKVHCPFGSFTGTVAEGMAAFMD